MEYLEILEKIRIDLETQQVNPEQFAGRIICMSMFNDIDWTKNGNSLDCISNFKEVSEHWSFFGLGEEDTNQKENGAKLPIL